MSEPRKMLSARDIAEIRGCHVSTVSDHAKRFGIGSMVGNTRVFTEEEKDRLCELIRDSAGNPDWTTDDE